MTSSFPKLRFATVWLAGCSGCHMSFLDLDAWLFELAKHVDVVFSPVASDIKEFPEGVACAWWRGRWPMTTTWNWP
jgi:NAD-reducing hydrogenase small subunit